jgi:hypothetical protein
LERGRQSLLTILGREDDMNAEARIGVRHGSSLWDFVIFVHGTKLPRWAKVGRPFGALHRNIPFGTCDWKDRLENVRRVFQSIL